MNVKRAFLFPGQGAQFVGMGKDFYEQYEEARKIVDKVSVLSGIDMKQLCFEGPEDKLNQTEYTQLAIVTTSLAILEVMTAKGICADIATGLSLGEYVALIYGGMLSLEDGIHLIQKRGYYMGNLLPKEEYAMAAVLGLDSHVIEEICNKVREQGKFVVPANYNCNSQTAISGESTAIEEVMVLLKEAGARKVIPLKTGGPFHTEKLEEAKLAYEKELEQVKFQQPGDVQVIKNLDGSFYQEDDKIKEILANHIVSPVRFDEAIRLMAKEGVQEYLEIGPGKTLTGFIKKENKEVRAYAISSVEALENYLHQEEK